MIAVYVTVLVRWRGVFK